MSETNKIKPTWAAVIDVLIMSVQNDTPLSRAAARHELIQIGEFLDSTYPDTAPALQSHWDNHPEWDVEDWRLEVMHDDTRLGYLDWIEAREIEKEAELHRNHKQPQSNHTG